MTHHLNMTEDHPGTDQLKLFTWVDIARWPNPILAKKGKATITEGKAQ